MKNLVNGFKDMYTILTNERKLGGVIEAKFIRLRSGEEYENAVITNVELMGSVFYSIGFMNIEGHHMIVNMSEISLISVPVHKRILDVNNKTYKQMKTEEKLHYLSRLYEVNEGSYTAIFLDEAKLIIDDIGIEAAKNRVDVSFFESEPQKVYSIA